jgi:hypothetical protein
MQEYNIGSSTLYDIKARKEQLLEFATDSETFKSIEKGVVYTSLKWSNLLKCYMSGLQCGGLRELVLLDHY